MSDLVKKIGKSWVGRTLLALAAVAALNCNHRATILVDGATPDSGKNDMGLADNSQGDQRNKTDQSPDITNPDTYMAKKTTCGTSIAYDTPGATPAQSKIKFGTINTQWSRYETGKGWLYSGAQSNDPNGEPLIGISQSTDIGAVDCSKATLSGKINGLLVKNGEILCLKQGGHYGVIVPTEQTFDLWDKTKKPDYIKLKWHFNQEPDKGTFYKCNP